MIHHPKETTMQQTALFPEPTRTEAEPKKFRYYVLDNKDNPVAGFDAVDDAHEYYDNGEAVCLGDYDDEEDEGGYFLFDTLITRVYSPSEWPEDDEVKSVELHRANLDSLREQQAGGER
jgi:hypothetical protein